MMGASKVIMGATLVMILSLAIVLALVLVLLAELYFSLRRRQHLTKPHTHPTPTTTTTTSISASTHLPRPHGKLHHFLSLNTPPPSPPTPIYLPSPPSTSRHPQPQKAAPLPPLLDLQTPTKDHLVYISNPIFDNESGAAQKEDDTPYETPDTSPSGPQKEGVRVITPPLTPIKDLPTKACSITLSDARSFGASCSESNSQNAAFSPTYSGSPSTSPSW